MTARKMTVRGVEIPASVLDAADAKIAECTSRPFTHASLSAVVRVKLNRSRGAEEWPAVWWDDGPPLAADRIIQRHRKAGRITQPKRGQWLWVGGPVTRETESGYPSDAIDRILGRSSMPPIRPNDAESVYLAAGCPSMMIHTDVAVSLARGLDDRRKLVAIQAEIGDWKGRGYTLAKYMILRLPTRWDRQGAVLRRSDAIAYMHTHGWPTFTDADLDAATEGEDILWA